ncbi:alpha/beta hydrolase fold domain-containing protein [Aminobacter aminovorans]|uniref:Acetyl esterase/lipase n=1 Tax=Aminobacter aminovorans TaxID=83263 RepID=A0AAC8YVY4_AMIAI|nr:alpha/beta hydrolase fold domain-containing protein [Aminobacter aminovorans]AMS45506.1 alpha/beta hydrolase [Aminobacter aminovorans]MBB3708581.1 acetyl esterase/lipase [Aminobacter aminovorans]
MKLDEEIETRLRDLSKPDAVRLLKIESMSDIELARAQNADRTRMTLARTDRTGVNTETLSIEVSDGTYLDLRMHRPALVDEGTKRPCLYFLHSGGMIAGTPEGDDEFLVRVTREMDCVTTSLAYRLAPEHPAPVGAGDCYDGLMWVMSNANALGIDPTAIAVGGSSAGGGLAASCALAAVRGGIRPRFLLLRYPQLDDRHLSPSSQVSWPVWPHAVSVGAWKAVLGFRFGTDAVTPLEAPGRATQLNGMPSTFIDVGAMDTFRDDCIAFASRLLASDVPTELHVYPGCCHGFDVIAPDAALSVAARERAVAALGRAWRKDDGRGGDR